MFLSLMTPAWTDYSGYHPSQRAAELVSINLDLVQSASVSKYNPNHTAVWMVGKSTPITVDITFQAWEKLVPGEPLKLLN